MKYLSREETTKQEQIFNADYIGENISHRQARQTEKNSSGKTDRYLCCQTELILEERTIKRNPKTGNENS